MVSINLQADFMPTLGPIKIALYGEDEVLERDKRKASSQPGRMVNGKWSTLHEIGNRKLIREWEEESHSLTRNFYNHGITQGLDVDTLNAASTFGAGFLNLKCILGTVRTGSSPHDGPGSGSDNGFRGGSGSDCVGIVIGTGNTAFSFEDFKLKNKIVEGTCPACGCNCCCCSRFMSYIAAVDHTIDASTYMIYNASCDQKWRLALPRFFNNNSGGTITVKETGIYTRLTNPAFSFLHARDVFACVACVVNGGQIKITYSLVSPAVAA